jgi:hypothetical protein
MQISSPWAMETRLNAVCYQSISGTAETVTMVMPHVVVTVGDSQLTLDEIDIPNRALRGAAALPRERICAQPNMQKGY